MSTSELAAWRGFLRVHCAVIRDLDAALVTAHDMPLTSYEVLLYIDGTRDGRMRMSDLAESVLLSRSGVTRLVDRLEKAGMVRRDNCAEDARGAYAVITTAGRRALADARLTHHAGVRERFLRHLSAEEREQLAELWERIEPGAAQ